MTRFGRTKLSEQREQRSLSPTEHLVNKLPVDPPQDGSCSLSLCI